MSRSQPGSTEGLAWATLAVTIPPFYLALLGQRPTLVLGGYLSATVLLLASAWRRTSHARRVGDLALATLFAGCALLPLGQDFALVALRLLTPCALLVRLLTPAHAWLRRNQLPRLLTLALLIFGSCGLGFWWLEPHVHSYGDGLWLAFTTAATVGYGDIVPSTPAAKIFAVFVVLLGVSVLSLVTAAIAASWVQTEERRIEREILHDLRREVGALRQDLARVLERMDAMPPSRAGHAD